MTKPHFNAELKKMRSATKPYWEVHLLLEVKVQKRFREAWYYALAENSEYDIIHLGYSADGAWRTLQQRNMLHPSDYPLTHPAPTLDEK